MMPAMVSATTETLVTALWVEVRAFGVRTENLRKTTVPETDREALATVIFPHNLNPPPPPLHWGWTSLFTPSLQMPVLILRFVDPTRSEDITGQLYLKATSDLWSQVCKHTLCKKRLNVEILWGMFKDIYALSGEVLATEWYNYD